MNTSCEKLPLVNLNASKVESRRKRTGKTPTLESFKQEQEDAIKIMSLADLDDDVSLDDKIEPEEKYLIETIFDKPRTVSSKKPGVGMRQEALRKPHYTRLYAFDNKLIFHAACCLPLTVIAASLDREPVTGKVLYNSYSEKEGGKLVYEFQGESSELIIDVKRSESIRAQRLILRFKISRTQIFVDACPTASFGREHRQSIIVYSLSTADYHLVLISSSFTKHKNTIPMLKKPTIDNMARRDVPII